MGEAIESTASWLIVLFMMTACPAFAWHGIRSVVFAGQSNARSNGAVAAIFFTALSMFFWWAFAEKALDLLL